MRITDLNKEERMALVAWARLIVRADREVSDEEADQLKKLAKDMGTQLFREAIEDADQQIASLDDLKKQATEITSQEARELIFSIVYELALPGTIVPREAKVLQWLAKVWNVYAPL